MKKLVLASLITLGLLGTATHANAQSYPGPSGTHVLKQIHTLSQLEQVAPQVEAALDNPGVTTFSIRVPWRSIETSPGVFDWAILERAREIAGEKELHVRFMAGRHTPRDYIVNGPHYLFDGPDHFGNTYNPPLEIPLPCNKNAGPNGVFMSAYRSWLKALVPKLQELNVPYLHGAGVGRLWAELDAGAEVQSYPGNTIECIVETHRRIFTAIQNNWPGPFELPLSGHGNTGAIASAWFTQASAIPGRVWFQVNGLHNDCVNWRETIGVCTPPSWATSPNGWGAGYQMYTPGETYTKSGQTFAYNFSEVYDRVRESNGDYVEIYLESFNPARAETPRLLAEAAEFAGIEPEPEPDPCVQVVAPASIQAAVDANPAGTKFCLSGHFQLAQTVVPKDDQVFVGPAVVEGVNGADTAFSARFVADGVVIDGLEIFGFDLRAVEPGDFTVVRNSDIHHNDRNGIGAGNTIGVVIEDNEIHHNGSTGELGSGAAGIKMAASGDRGRGPGAVVRGNHVYANTGNGIWFDVDSGGDLIEDNLVEGNTRRGIFYEVSRGPVVITGNTSIGNNLEGLGRGSGIGVSSSKHVLIEFNFVADNVKYGMAFGEVNRDHITWDYPLEDVVVRNNQLNGQAVRGCNQDGVTCSGNEA